MADKTPPPVPPTPAETPLLPTDTPIRGSPLELVDIVDEPGTTDVVMLGLWVIVEETELLVDAGEAAAVEAGPVELAVWLATLPESVVEPAPTPTDARPPPVPPTPRDTPPLPRETPIRGSPLELVVVKVTSEDVDRLGL